MSCNREQLNIIKTELNKIINQKEELLANKRSRQLTKKSAAAHREINALLKDSCRKVRSLLTPLLKKANKAGVVLSASRAVEGMFYDHGMNNHRGRRFIFNRYGEGGTLYLSRLGYRKMLCQKEYEIADKFIRELTLGIDTAASLNKVIKSIKAV